MRRLLLFVGVFVALYSFAFIHIAFKSFSYS